VTLEEQVIIGSVSRARSVERSAREQSRARYPDSEGFVERCGQRLFYEVYGDGEETVFLIPTWSLIHSRHWKMQIPYFARHFGCWRWTASGTVARIAVTTRRVTTRASSRVIVWR